MIRPVFMYRYERTVNLKTGRPGTRYNLTGWDGPGCYHVLGNSRLKRTQMPVVYVNKWRESGRASDPRKGSLILAAPGNRNLTSLYETAPEAPGKGFGDLSLSGERPGKDAVLSLRDDVSGTLELAIFRNLGAQAETLFLTWLDGGVYWTVFPKPLVSAI